MEMRSGEDIRIGQDVTPPLFPLSFSLHHSFLHSHCSSCFSPLPHTPFHPTIPPSSSSSSSPSLFYCSALCSSSDSPLHFYSAEFHLFRHLSSHTPLTSDLRAALRLLHSLPSHSYRHGRISGLLTNRDKLIADDELLFHVRDGARAMSSARRLRDGKDVLIPGNENHIVLFEEEEAALCLILTNAVEVQDNEGRALGVAVYDTTFSWINHSCSANACYRFSISPPGTPSFPVDTKPRIVPSGINGEKNVYINFESRKDYAEYGPRLIVRSIKRIGKNEEVTVAYTDLLQPKAIRQSELWSKYRFVCCCSRCSASPPSYVDHILQEITTSNLASSSLSSDHSFCRDKAMRKLTDLVDEVITEYLSVDDAESCCEKLESLLIVGLLDETSENKEIKPQLSVRLHPLNHLSLNVYMTLASAYSVRASDLQEVNSEMDKNQLKSFNMMRKAAAYSFLLAASTCHLLCFEASLIVSVGNFCTSAGESLLTLARSSAWNSFGNRELPDSQLLSLGEHKCSKCSMIDRYEANQSVSQGQYEDIKSISSEFLDCMSSFSTEIWSSLSQGCHYLKMFSNPTDFVSLGILTNASQFEANSDCWTEQKFTNHARMNIFQLGVHCLLYGKLLAGMCYNKHEY
ncbi:protein SET DOMAIN GROUP 41 [Euphorbia lathyris]|uniref:protein SET DOMAIN GROUP 41 n=1 Tax=Euphorbia lathyris TaxID=212925 RepID=UPI0033140287